MVKLYSINDLPALEDQEPKAVLKTIVENHADVDLDNVVIEASRLPEILSSLVSHWDETELQTLIDAVDEEETGKLDLSKASQIIMYFLKKQTARAKEFTKVVLKISTQMTISHDTAMIIVYFYPQIIKAVDDGQCILQ